MSCLRKMFLALAIGLLLLNGSAYADLITLYAVPQTTSGYTSIAASSTISGVTATSLTRTANLAGSSFGNHFYFSDWGSTVDLTKYYENTLTVNPGQALNLASVSYSVEATTTATTTFQLRSSLDGFSSIIDQFNLNSDLVTNRTSILSGLGSIVGSVTFRFYATAPNANVTVGFANHLPGGAGGGLSDVGQNIMFEGTVVPVPAGVVMAGVGLVCIAGVSWYRRKKVTPAIV